MKYVFFGFMYKVVRLLLEIIENYVIYCGYEVVDVFVDYMIKFEGCFLNMLCNFKFMDLFEEEI